MNSDLYVYLSVMECLFFQPVYECKFIFSSKQMKLILFYYFVNYINIAFWVQGVKARRSNKKPTQMSTKPAQVVILYHLMHLARKKNEALASQSRRYNSKTK